MTAVFLFELDEVANDKAVALRKGYIVPRWEVELSRRHTLVPAGLKYTSHLGR